MFVLFDSTQTILNPRSWSVYKNLINSRFTESLNFCMTLLNLLSVYRGMIFRLGGLVVRLLGSDPEVRVRYQIFWEVVGLERSPLGLVSSTEELLGRKNNGSGPESREYCRKDPLLWPRFTLYPEKLALTSPTSGGFSVGIVRSRTQATEFVCFICLFYLLGRRFFIT
jgi:hypothetical protein